MLGSGVCTCTAPRTLSHSAVAAAQRLVHIRRAITAQQFARPVRGFPPAPGKIRFHARAVRAQLDRRLQCARTDRARRPPCRKAGRRARGGRALRGCRCVPEIPCDHRCKKFAFRPGRQMRCARQTRRSTRSRQQRPGLRVDLSDDVGSRSAPASSPKPIPHTPSPTGAGVRPESFCSVRRDILIGSLGGTNCTRSSRIPCDPC